jgi:hypothetical protein
MGAKRLFELRMSCSTTELKRRWLASRVSYAWRKMGGKQIKCSVATDNLLEARRKIGAPSGAN